MELNLGNCGVHGGDLRCVAAMAQELEIGHLCQSVMSVGTPLGAPVYVDTNLRQKAFCQGGGLAVPGGHPVDASAIRADDLPACAYLRNSRMSLVPSCAQCHTRRFSRASKRRSSQCGAVLYMCGSWTLQRLRTSTT